MSPEPRFGRVITAMVTPFDDDGALDLDAAVELARWLAAHGSDGLVLSGTTGESSVLTDDEKVSLWRAVADAVTIPVLAGTGSNDTAHSVALTRQAAASGVDGVLVVTPYYNRPSQAGLHEHFRAVAEAAGDLPVVLYDIPIRTGRRIETATMLRLAREVPAVVGVKDAAGDPPTTAHLVAQAPAGFRGLQRRRRPDAAVAVGRRRRRDQRRRALGRAPVPACRRRLLRRRPRRGDRRQRGAARLLRLRVHRGLPEPAPGQGGAAGARPAGGPVPTAHGRGDAGARRHGGEDHRRSRSTGGHARLAERTPKPVRVVFLGGLGEIGRNCACIEVDGRIVVLDCGIMFPDPDMPGVDLVLPEFTYLYDRKDRVDGIVLTHGHEDHTGGLAYLLRELQAPIYGSELTVGLARHRVEEAGLAGQTRFIVVRRRRARPHRACDVEFIPVTHSVPEAFAIAFHTPQGVILHSGDFKLDLQPVDGRRTDLSRMGELARTDGIRLLLSDSTNAEEPGFTESESSVGTTLRRVFASVPGQAHRGRLLRQPHAPGAADHRRGHGQRPQGGDARTLHGEERRARAPPRHHRRARRRARRHRGRRRPCRRGRSA